MKRLATWLVRSSTVALVAAAKPHFDWDAVEPTWDLRYTSCYGDEFACARILMPLDWLNEDSDPRTVALAVIKVPAAVGPDDESYGGTVMVNPGGPGDSGVMDMLVNGHFIQDMMGPNRTYEVLSFDPRGMAFSTPRAKCFANEQARDAHAWQERGLMQWDTTDQVTDAHLRTRLAYSRAYGRQCEAYRDEGLDYNIHEFTSTASVAHDLLRLVDETEALRKKQLSSAMSDRQAGAGGHAAQHALSDPDGSDHDAESAPARLQYYGTSYGTVLGNFFLSMFPGRVKRIIFDGVVVGEDWVAENWSGNAENVQDCFDHFYETCFDAAGSRCALKKGTDKSWHDVKRRVQSLIDRLRSEPVPVASPSADRVETVISGDDIVDLMFNQMYAPLDFFESLASTLAHAAEGNYTLLYDELVPAGPGEHGQQDNESPEDAVRRYYSWKPEAGDSTACGDVSGHPPLVFQDYRAMVDHYRALYPDLQRQVEWIPFRCSGWKAVPRLRFTGPFTSPEATPAGEEKEGRPSAPLLLLSNVYDPITPLQSAKTVSKGHPGSRVLTQTAVGHCIMLSSPSECTKRAVWAYMKDGTMPAEGTECKADCRPFENCPYDRGHLPR